MISIWKKVSPTNRIINFEQFQEALNQIPQISKEIEEAPEEEKPYVLYKILSIDNTKSYKKRLVGFNQAFGIKDKEEFRELPAEFRSKKKYKPLSTNEVKKVLEESQIRKTKMEAQLRVQAQEKSKLDHSKITNTLNYSSLDESAFLMGRSLFN